MSGWIRRDVKGLLVWTADEGGVTERRSGDVSAAVRLSKRNKFGSKWSPLNDTVLWLVCFDEGGGTFFRSLLQEPSVFNDKFSDFTDVHPYLGVKGESSPSVSKLKGVWSTTS